MKLATMAHSTQQFTMTMVSGTKKLKKSIVFLTNVFLLSFIIVIAG